MLVQSLATRKKSNSILHSSSWTTSPVPYSLQLGTHTHKPSSLESPAQNTHTQAQFPTASSSEHTHKPSSLQPPAQNRHTQAQFPTASSSEQTHTSPVSYSLQLRTHTHTQAQFPTASSSEHTHTSPVPYSLQLRTHTQAQFPTASS